MTVDDYVQTRVLPQFQASAEMLRQLMREMAPDAVEAMGYGMPVYKGRRIFAWIRANKSEVLFGFSRGTQFEDRFGLLKGTGKAGRHVKIKNLDAINQEALAYYIQQALELDRQ